MVVVDGDVFSFFGQVTDERMAVVPVQTVYGTDPDEAFAVLEDIAYSIIGKSVAGGDERGMDINGGMGGINHADGKNEPK